MENELSFSAKVKDELYGQYGSARHCQIAELAAIVAILGRAKKDNGETVITLDTASERMARKYFTLLSKTISIDKCGKVLRGDAADKLLSLLKRSDTDDLQGRATVDGVLVQQNCCKRSFLRGAFLSAGSVSDPSKAYHFEIICKKQELAMQIADVLGELSLGAKVTDRKGSSVVYLKEASQIVTALGLMGASQAVLDFENIRVLKDMRGSVNRRVNCETANIGKTVDAAVRQIEDIEKIRANGGLAILPDNLRELAELRLMYPDMTLKDLGDLTDPPIGKSGVNHRMRRISEIAGKIS